MTSRYSARPIGTNAARRYKNLFKKRNVNFINQYLTPNLKHPTVEEMESLTMLSHIWKQGDRLFKLANQYYNDPELWWSIAWFNQTPTEGHLDIGDTVTIPLPLERILDYLDV